METGKREAYEKLNVRIDEQHKKKKMFTVLHFQ